MAILFHAAGILAGLASVTLAAFERPGGRTVLGLSLGFAGTGLWLVLQPHGAAFAGLSWIAPVLLAAIGCLLVRRLRFLVALWAGALGALWSAFLSQQGLPLAVALLLATGALATAMLCKARVVAFAPPTLRFEALLMICVLGLIVAIGPKLLEGWRTASALNTGSSAWTDVTAGAALSGGSWALMLGAASVVAGALQALRRAR